MQYHPVREYLTRLRWDERLDGRSLGDVFDTMVRGPSVSDLIAAGFLSRYCAYAPSTIDLSDIHNRAGDFAADEAAAAMDKPSITDDIVAHYQRLAPGRQAIAFAASVEHSRHLADAFAAAGIAAGIAAAHVDGTTDRDQRRAIVAAFGAGQIQVMSNVELFGEGFNVPATEVVILARPTQSLGLYLQQVGRALRPAPGKDFATVLDHAGNIARHGLPDDPREWSLDASPRRKRTAEALPAVRQCPACFLMHRPAAACPECGHQYAPMVREIEERPGELIEISRDDWTGGIDIARARGAELRALLEAAGDDIKRLRQISRIRGYRRGWATHRAREFAGRAAA